MICGTLRFEDLQCIKVCLSGKVVVVVVVVVGRHKNRAPVETTRNSLEDEMTKPPWTSVVRVCF